MRASADSPRMFESDFLDFFTRIPWWVVPLLFVPITTASFGWGLTRGGLAVLPSLGVAAIFFVFWTLSEYWLHRTFFHWKPDTWWGPKLHFFVHGVHHDWPHDKYRLVMPPAVSLGLGTLVFGLFYGLFSLAGAAALTFPAFAGYVFGYMVYDITHYATHHAKMRSAWGKALRAHHMKHHFQDTDKKFGVSFIIWDRVFGTL